MWCFWRRLWFFCRFTGAFTLKGIIVEIYTTLALKKKVNHVYIVSFFMCIWHVQVTSFFRVNNVNSRCNGTASSAVTSRKGVTRARCHPLINPGIFFLAFYCFACNYYTSGSNLKYLFMGVYRRVYPRHTSKEVIFKLLKYFKICKLFLSLFHF